MQESDKVVRPPSPDSSSGQDRPVRSGVIRFPVGRQPAAQRAKGYPVVPDDDDPGPSAA